MRRGARKAPKQVQVEIQDAVLVITIRAEIPLGAEDAERDIESALDTLRGTGSAEVTGRRVVGTLVKEAQ